MLKAWRNSPQPHHPNWQHPGMQASNRPPRNVASTHIWSYTTRNFKGLSLQKTTQCTESPPFKIFYTFHSAQQLRRCSHQTHYPMEKIIPTRENCTPPSLGDQAETTHLPKKHHLNLAWLVPSPQDICPTVTSQPFLIPMSSYSTWKNACKVLCLWFHLDSIWGPLLERANNSLN